MKSNIQLKYSNYVAFSHFHGTTVNNSGLLNSRLTPELSDEELGKKEIRKFLFEGDMRVLSLTDSKGLSDALSAIITELEVKNEGLAIIKRFAQGIQNKRQQTRKCFW